MTRTFRHQSPQKKQTQHILAVIFLLSLGLGLMTACGVPPENPAQTDTVSRYFQLRLRKVGVAQMTRKNGINQTELVLCQGSEYSFPVAGAKIAANQFPMIKNVARADLPKKQNGRILLKGTQVGQTTLQLRIRQQGEAAWKTLPVHISVISCQMSVQVCQGSSKKVSLPSNTIFYKNKSKVENNAIAALQFQTKNASSTSMLAINAKTNGKTSISATLKAQPNAQPQTFLIQVNVSTCN